MATARTINLVQLADRAAKAAEAIERQGGFGSEPGIFVDPTTIIGRILREGLDVQFGDLMKAATNVADQVNAVAVHGGAEVPTHAAATLNQSAIPVIHWPGRGPIIWGFVLRDLERFSPPMQIL